MAQRGVGPGPVTGGPQTGGRGGGPAPVQPETVEVIGEIDLPDIDAPPAQAEPPFTMGPPPTHRWIEPDKTDERGMASRYATGLINAINPLPILKELFAPDGEGLKRIGTATLDAHKEQFAKAKELYELSLLPDQSWINRRMLQLQAFGHVSAGLTPLIGPGAANAGEKLGTGDPGLMAEAAGEITGILAPMKLLSPKRGAATTGATTSGRIASAAEGARVAAERGIPITRGEARGSNLLRTLERTAEETSYTGSERLGPRLRDAQAEAVERAGREMADEYSGGAPPSTRETAGAAATQAAAAVNRDVADAFAGTAQKIQERVGPQPTTAMQAGEEAFRRGGERVQAFREQAGKHYGELDDILNDPANAKEVVVAYEDGPPISDRAAAAGIQRIQVPVRQVVQSPIDLEATNMMDTLRKVNDEWSSQWPQIRQQQSEAFSLLSSIVGAKSTVVPLAKAEKLLGYAKAIAREEGGLAKLMVAKLQQAVDRAVADLGPDAQIALTKGRAASRAQWQANEVLAAIKGVPNDRLTVQAAAEPVRGFRKMTAADDTAANLLRRVTSETPEVAPIVARALLDEVFDIGLAEGTIDFTKARSMKAAWDKIGDETKKALFRDPAVVRQVDDFFKQAMRRQDTPMLGDLPTEPVQAFKALVRDRDEGILGLEAMDKLTRDPATGVSPVTQRLARAWMDDQITRAAIEGFKSADAMKRNWRNLGPRTQRLFYGDNVHNLNAFFQLVSDMKFQANPSRTAFARIIGDKVGVMLAAPVAFATGNPTAVGSMVIGPEVLAQLLVRPATAKALTRAMRTPTTSQRAAAAASAGLINAAKKAGIALAATTSADESFRSQTGDRPLEVLGEVDVPEQVP